MNIAAIREKLNNYIRVADDEKIMAMYVLLKDNMNEATEWWKDERLLKEMDVEYQNWKTGKTKGYTLDEAEQKIDQLRSKRQNDTPESKRGGTYLKANFFNNGAKRYQVDTTFQQL